MGVRYSGLPRGKNGRLPVGAKRAFPSSTTTGTGRCSPGRAATRTTTIPPTREWSSTRPASAWNSAARPGAPSRSAPGPRGAPGLVRGSRRPATSASTWNANRPGRQAAGLAGPPPARCGGVSVSTRPEGPAGPWCARPGRPAGPVGSGRAGRGSSGRSGWSRPECRSARHAPGLFGLTGRLAGLITISGLLVMFRMLPGSPLRPCPASRLAELTSMASSYAASAPGTGPEQLVVPAGKRSWFPGARQRACEQTVTAQRR
jgi:hypothetical protein